MAFNTIFKGNSRENGHLTQRLPFHGQILYESMQTHRTMLVYRLSVLFTNHCIQCLFWHGQSFTANLCTLCRFCQNSRACLNMNGLLAFIFICDWCCLKWLLFLCDILSFIIILSCKESTLCIVELPTLHGIPSSWSRTVGLLQQDPSVCRQSKNSTCLVEIHNTFLNLFGNQ